MVKKVWRYVYFFRRNTRTCQTDKLADIARRHRPRICVASRSKNAENCSELFITMSLASLVDGTHTFVLVHKLRRIRHRLFSSPATPNSQRIIRVTEKLSCNMKSLISIGRCLRAFKIRCALFANLTRHAGTYVDVILQLITNWCFDILCTITFLLTKLMFTFEFLSIKFSNNSF